MSPLYFQKVLTLLHLIALLVVLRPNLLIRAVLDPLFSKVLFYGPGDQRTHTVDG